MDSWTNQWADDGEMIPMCELAYEGDSKMNN